jgi:ribose/xylose/arabinose/galactoside ABC-type transport system permease subunit
MSNIQQSIPPSDTGGAGTSANPVRRVIQYLINTREAGIFVIVLLVGVLLTFASPYFFTVSNLQILARLISLNAIIAIGMTMVILLGDIDLSVGSVVALASVVTGFVMVRLGLDLPPVVLILLGILAGLLVGVVSGLFNGFLIIKTGVPAFIITLGMMGIARGIALVITKGSSISGLPTQYLSLGQGFLFGVPVPVWIMLILAVATHIFLSSTATGRYIYFTGSNKEAAALSGIPVNRIKLLVFMLASTLAAVEAVIETSRMSTAQPAAGVGYELTAIGAVIIGGASFLGGEGTILGTLLGATLLGLIANGLVLLGVSSYWQTVFSGSIIIIAVALDIWRKRRSA